MSDQPKHTPGPWSADKATYHNGYIEYFVRRDSDAVAISGDITDPETGQPSEANARLIAAAPDLLDVLKSSLNEHKEVRKFLNVRISEGESVYVWLEETESMIGRIEAAIAKAEGRGE